MTGSPGVGKTWCYDRFAEKTINYTKRWTKGGFPNIMVGDNHDFRGLYAAETFMRVSDGVGSLRLQCDGGWHPGAGHFGSGSRQCEWSAMERGFSSI